MRQSQAALAVVVRDLLVTNVALAVNLTLLRRDAVLATRPALDQRTRDRVRLSAFLPDKLFGPQADEALEEQARNPTTVLRRPVSPSGTRDAVVTPDSSATGSRPLPTPTVLVEAGSLSVASSPPATLGADEPSPVSLHPPPMLSLPPPNSASIPVGARLSAPPFLPVWISLFHQDPWLVAVIEEGLRISFTSPPPTLLDTQVDSGTARSGGRWRPVIDLSVLNTLSLPHTSGWRRHVP